MTEQHQADEPTPGGDPMADEPLPDAGADGSANAKGREWLSQLEAMIQDIATQAAPVARQVAAKAAELTAVAAVKAGPFAQKAAEVTTDAGQKLADRAQSLAAELRGEGTGTTADEVLETDADVAAAPEATFEDAVDSTSDAVPEATFEDATSSEDERGSGSPF
jgi:methionine synthase I (cobalamin-dependent)